MFQACSTFVCSWLRFLRDFYIYDYLSLNTAPQGSHHTYLLDIWCVGDDDIELGDNYVVHESRGSYHRCIRLDANSPEQMEGFFVEDVQNEGNPKIYKKICFCTNDR